MVGFVFVLIMTATVIIQACLNGLPGWYDGEFQAVGFQNIGACPGRVGFRGLPQRAARLVRRRVPGRGLPEHWCVPW